MKGFQTIAKDRAVAGKMNWDGQKGPLWTVENRPDHQNARPRQRGVHRVVEHVASLRRRATSESEQEGPRNVSNGVDDDEERRECRPMNIAAVDGERKESEQEDGPILESQQRVGGWRREAIRWIHGWPSVVIRHAAHESTPEMPLGWKRSIRDDRSGVNARWRRAGVKG